MTTPEHTLVGIHTAIALRVHERFGWTVVALAGIASNFPDWDGLPMLVDIARFEAGHRVWGHNFVWITISSFVVAWLQWRYHWIESLAMRLRNYAPAGFGMEQQAKSIPLVAMFLVCFGVQTIHLPCDMVVSGGHGLSDWLIRPFWPISSIGYVFPLIPWGDVGPILIMMAGAISLAKFPSKLSLQSIATLSVLCVYLLIRGWMRGTIGS